MEVTYKTAQKAKEFGFQEKCFGFYDSDRNLQTIEDIIEMKGDSIKYYYRTLNTPKWMKEMCSAPTQDQLRTWLRNKYKIDCNACWSYNDDKKWSGQCYFLDDRSEIDSLIRISFIDFPNENNGLFETYEDALEETLFYALDLINKE